MDVGGAVRSLHDKSYLPGEPGFWEASWYGRGPGGHAVYDPAGLRAGVLVCTELWFLQYARALGRDGTHLVATPRCTPAANLNTWLAGGRACAVLSGAWSLSSNSAEPEHDGMDWAIDPEGEVVVTTSRQHPYATAEIRPRRRRSGQGPLPGLCARPVLRLGGLTRGRRRLVGVHRGGGRGIRTAGAGLHGGPSFGDP